MSEAVDLDKVVHVERTDDMYEDAVHLAMHRPLALGPLIYAKLARRGSYEVYWDHFHQAITVTTPKGIVVETKEEAFPIPRFDRVRYVNMFVEAVLDHEG